MENFYNNYKEKYFGGNEHFISLRRSYDAVGLLTWQTSDFENSRLQTSRDLFTLESLNSRKPLPKKLEVYALLSGVNFPTDFTNHLCRIQQLISEILGNSLHYWVHPWNMGVEYSVFKWPNEPWDQNYNAGIVEVLRSITTKCFLYSIIGVQINPDGCVVARGFDENAEIFRIRALLRSLIPNLPKRQSNWAHIPIGRILEPVGREKFENMSILMNKINCEFIGSTKISSMKFIHETRWYMEERQTIEEYIFNE